MQFVHIRLENGKGEVVETSPLNFADILLHLWELPRYKTEFPVLASIDPYGHTIFNVKQIPSLLSELGKLYPLVPSGEARTLMVECNHILNKVKQHDYVRFIGD